VHTGEFDRETYKLIDKAYRIREKCDYSDFYIVSKEDSLMQIEHARKFIHITEQYLKRKMDKPVP
jgi:uncharacterized protein (UPF0332 family)